MKPIKRPTPEELELIFSDNFSTLQYFNFDDDNDLTLNVRGVLTVITGRLLPLRYLGRVIVTPYLNVIFVNQAYPTEVETTVFHELLHLFGCDEDSAYRRENQWKTLP